MGIIRCCRCRSERDRRPTDAIRTIKGRGRGLNGRLRSLNVDRVVDGEPTRDGAALEPVHSRSVRPQSCGSRCRHTDRKTELDSDSDFNPHAIRVSPPKAPSRKRGRPKHAPSAPAVPAKRTRHAAQTKSRHLTQRRVDHNPLLEYFGPSSPSLLPACLTCATSGDLGLQSASEASSGHPENLSDPATESASLLSDSGKDDSDRGSAHSGGQRSSGSRLPRTLAIVAEAIKSRFESQDNPLVGKGDDDSMTGASTSLLLLNSPGPLQR
jgi:hypothetical protein